MSKKCIKVIFSVILCDAGDATRALEIAEGIRMYCPDEYSIEITFLSHGSRFEDEVISKGFKLFKCSPALPGVGVFYDYKSTPLNLAGSSELAEELITGEIEALNILKPDILIHGYNPFAGLARRMTEKKIPSISYLPLPLSRELISGSIIDFVPERAIPEEAIPKEIREKILKDGKNINKYDLPIFRQQNIIDALNKLEWNENEGKINNVIDMLEADMTLVNDFKEFYDASLLPENFKLTGPLYAAPLKEAPIDDEVLRIFNKENKRTKVFVSFGSSGNKKCLIEVTKALQEGENYSAVILCPPAVASVDDIIPYVKDKENFYVTDKFVPASIVNPMADIAITHGGQGTLQTAIHARTPIIGFGVQAEQQINLHNIESFGGAVNIIMKDWNEDNLRMKLHEVVNNPHYKESINKLADILAGYDGKRNAAEAVWTFIENNQK